MCSENNCSYYFTATCVAFAFLNIYYFDRENADSVDCWLLANSVYWFYFGLVPYLDSITGYIEKNGWLHVFISLYAIFIIVFHVPFCMLGVYVFAKTASDKTSNHRTSTFVLAMFYQIIVIKGFCFMLIAFTVESIKEWRNKGRKVTKISPEDQLMDYYEGKTKPRKTTLQKFVNTNKEILSTLKLMKKEEEIIQEKFTSRRPSILNRTCVVCLVDLGENEQVTAIGCRHPFHYDCLIDWAKVKMLCPMCQQPLREAMLKDLIVS